MSVIGELNLDLIFYGLPQEMKLEHEHLAKDLSITLGGSSAIFAAQPFLCSGTKLVSVPVLEAIPSAKFVFGGLERAGWIGPVSRVRRLPGKTTGLTIVLAEDVAHREWARLLDSGGTARDVYGIGEACKSKLSSKFTFSRAAGPLTSAKSFPFT